MCLTETNMLAYFSEELAKSVKQFLSNGTSGTEWKKNRVEADDRNKHTSLLWHGKNYQGQNNVALTPLTHPPTRGC